MTTRILPAAGDPDAARSITALLSQLPDAEPAPPVPDSTSLLDMLGRMAAESVDELPEVVLVHERIGPVPALELIREVALRFPAVGVVLLSSDAGPGLFSAAMDSGARGLIALPLSYEELSARVQAAALWAVGVRRHLGGGAEVFTGPGGRVVTVTGAKGGVGTTFTAVQFALAAAASGRRTALVDLDLQAGDVGSYLDVQFRRSIADLAGIQDISPASSRTPSTRTAPAWPCCWPRRTASGARRSTNAPPARSSAPCAPATNWSSSTAAPRSPEPTPPPWNRPTRPYWSPRPTWSPYARPSGWSACGSGSRCARRRTPRWSSTAGASTPRSSPR